MLAAALWSVLAINTRAETQLIFTIGQGSRHVQELIAALQLREIRYVCDVRSIPISNHAPDFCGVELRQHLSRAGIKYIALGDALGGRPQDREAYNTDGHVNYDKLIDLPTFQEGIDRLVRGVAAGHLIALFCSEGQPERCHRSKAIGRALSNRSLEVVHIDGEDNEVAQDVVMQRLSSPQMSLLAEDETVDPSRVSRGRYL